ncbi:hypothetical protein EW146_g6009 [Bondarzewia mesenterica]|uniref:Uncharacterized protein n=1 Tax=Bondarzewia mesenterica TaxID=1095465 RepID=A0A4S4LPV8_9AGAM|nr:hypothetical protein EW146_g6009 [Bondarzewia mesenterica]
MSDFSQPVSIPVSDPDAVLTTTIDVKNGRHQVYCDLCGKLILLTKFAAPGALLEHRSSNRCQELRKRRDKHLEKEYQASVIRSKNTFSSLGPIPSSSGSQTPSAAHSVTPTPPPPSVIPHVNPPLPHNLVPPSLHVPAPTMPISVPVSYRSRRIPEPVCPGIHIHWTPGSVFTTYAYHQHNTRTLSWEPVAFENEGDLVGD